MGRDDIGGVFRAVAGPWRRRRVGDRGVGVHHAFIAALAFVKRADVKITGLDWLFFLCALASLPLWYFTAATWAVVILTTVDLLGFGPTARKVRDDPHAESLMFSGFSC
jgi:hypothetical protein